MLAKTHRKRGLEIDPDETPPLHLGHRLRVDHIILGRELTKGSEGEQACLVCYDEYSGCHAAYPETQRNTDQSIQALQKFGCTLAHGKTLCVAKPDAAAELWGRSVTCDGCQTLQFQLMRCTMPSLKGEYVQ